MKKTEMKIGMKVQNRGLGKEVIEVTSLKAIDDPDYKGCFIGKVLVSSCSHVGDLVARRYKDFSTYRKV